MSRFKKFSGGTSIEEFEPLGFELNNEQFECYAAVQGAVLLDFIRDADGDSGGDAAKALYNFFGNVMDSANYERFMSVLNDKNTIIDLEFIGEIASWLVEQYSSRPTKQPGSSSNGATTPGISSTDEPLWQGTGLDN